MLKKWFQSGTVATVALLFLLTGPLAAQPVNQVMGDTSQTLAEAQKVQTWVEKLHEETDEVLGGAAERLLGLMETQLEQCRSQGTPVAPCDGLQEHFEDLVQDLDRLQKIDPEEVTKRVDQVREQLEADRQELAGLPEKTPGLAELEQKVQDELESLKSKRFEGKNGLPEKVKRKLTRLRKGAADAIDTDELQDTLDKLREEGCCKESPEREPGQGGEPAEEGDVPGAEPAEGDGEGEEPDGEAEEAEDEKDQEGKGKAEAPREKAIREQIERLKEKYEEETGRDFDKDAEKPVDEQKKIDEEHDNLLWETEGKIDQLEDELEQLDRQLAPEQAWQNWQEFVQGVKKLKGVLDREGHSSEFLDDFLQELEDQRQEWEEPPTHQTLERLKRKLERRMGGQDEFTPEELDKYLDEVFGSAFGGEDSPAPAGEGGRGSRGALSEAPQVDDVIDLGTLGRRIYEFPITAENTSCRGRHDFRTTFKTVGETPGGWFYVADPHTLSDLKMGQSKTVRAKVDLRTVEAGTLEGVLYIVCTTCPPPPVCTQNEKTFLVRATVQD